MAERRNLPSKDYEKKGRKRKYLPGEEGAMEAERGSISALLHLQKKRGYVEPFMESNPENFGEGWPGKRADGSRREGSFTKEQFPMPIIDGQLWEKYRKTNKDAKKKSILT